MASRPWPRSLRSALVALLLGACVQPVDGSLSDVRVAGPWAPPEHIRALGLAHRVTVTGAPPISPLGSCGPGLWDLCSHPACVREHPGTAEVRAFLMARFPYTTLGTSDACRRNSGSTSYLSIHSVGRAIDLMVPRISGDADNTRGDAIANYLVQNAEHIGIQRVIWDHAFWNGEGRFGLLTSGGDHTDHVHVEMSADGAARRTPFFTAPPPPVCTPSAEHCDGHDQDCDGRTDEGLVRGCGSDVGTCVAGTSTCHAGSWGACVGSSGAGAETCDGTDEDCDGAIDEALVRGCGSDVGDCVAGTSSCAAGTWGGCIGEVTAAFESCNGTDEDCDGATDEALVRSCGSDVGECVAGTETCAAAAWGACLGAIDPVPERCDALDNDCDGDSDDERICEREEIAWSSSRHGGSAESDVSGDGQADACAVVGGEVRCAVAGDHGLFDGLDGAALDTTDLFSAASFATGDLDGDGRSDVCGRQADRLVCWRSLGTRFAELVVGPAAGAALDVPALVDVDGDGRDDVCVRGAAGLTCHRSHGSGFDGLVRLAALSDAGGFSDPIHHGSIRWGDLDGDGRADVCARDAEGLRCWRSEGDHFGEQIVGPRWRDDAGFAALSRWSTLALADVTGDGRDDACIRTESGFGCAIATERGAADWGFTGWLAGPAMAPPLYERADVYATIRLGDLSGDGRADLCAREPEGVRCWIAGEHGFDRRIEGPALTDAAGWSAPSRHRSLRMADVSGDGLRDLCAIGADGLSCWISDGRGFAQLWVGPRFDDATLTTDGARASLRLAGGGARTSANGGLGGVMSCAASRDRSSAGHGGLAVLLGVLATLIARRR